MKQLVLLGGGHAHIHVLQDLARLTLPACRVTLVSPFDDLVYSGMVPGFVAGHYTLEVSSPGIHRPLRKPEHFVRLL